MSANELPALSADAIRDAFLREAEEDTQSVIRVAEQVAAFQEARTALESLHAQLCEAYRQAQARPNVAAKLAELRLPTLDKLTVSIGGGSRPLRRSAKKRTTRPAGGKTASQKAASAAPADSDDGA